jgi:ketopantoate reductase
MLSSITKILSEDAVVILLLPNHMQLRILWKRFRRDPGFANLGNFEKTGMHFTSRGTVKEWLKSAGLEVDRIADVTPDRAQSMSRVTFGIANALLSSEFIVIGKKA